MTTNGPPGQPTLTALAAAVEASLEPLERLAALRALLDSVDVAVRETVAAAREARASWAAVGQALTVSKQAAAKRFHQKFVYNVELGPLERDSGITYLHDVDFDNNEALAVGTRVELRDERGFAHAATVSSAVRGESGSTYELRITPRSKPSKPAGYVITTLRGRALLRICRDR